MRSEAAVGARPSASAPTATASHAARRDALEGLEIAAPGVVVRVLPPRARAVLRGPFEELRDALAAQGWTLPSAMLHAAVAGSRAVIRLGPDEWLLLDEADGNGERLHVQLSGALSRQPCSIVDVAHRQIAFAVEGELASRLLSAGCPLDLDGARFEPGRCTRTLLGRVEITLWRREVDRFELECWRSYAPHVWKLLEVAALDLD